MTEWRSDRNLLQSRGFLRKIILFGQNSWLPNTVHSLPQLRFPPQLMMIMLRKPVRLIAHILQQT